MSNTVRFMECIFPHNFRKLNNSSKGHVSEEAGILTPSGWSWAAAFTSVLVLSLQAFLNPLATPASVVPICPEHYLEK